MGTSLFAEDMVGKERRKEGFIDWPSWSELFDHFRLVTNLKLCFSLFWSVSAENGMHCEIRTFMITCSPRCPRSNCTFRRIRLRISSTLFKLMVNTVNLPQNSSEAEVCHTPVDGAAEGIQIVLNGVDLQL
jgi:hypothetical protein